MVITRDENEEKKGEEGESVSGIGQSIVLMVIYPSVSKLRHA